MFKSLDEKAIEEITALMLEKTRARLNDIGIDIVYDQKVVKQIAKEGFDSQYGARPLERQIRKVIDDRLAEDILDNKLDKDMVIRIYVQNDKLVFRNISDSKLAKDMKKDPVNTK